MVKPSTRLLQLAALLQTQLAICAHPDTTQGQFVHARRLARLYGRALYREYVAVEALALIMDGWQGVAPVTTDHSQAAFDRWMTSGRNSSLLGD